MQPKVSLQMLVLIDAQMSSYFKVKICFLKGFFKRKAFFIPPFKIRSIENGLKIELF